MHKILKKRYMNAWVISARTFDFLLFLSWRAEKYFELFLAQTTFLFLVFVFFFFFFHTCYLLHFRQLGHPIVTNSRESLLLTTEVHIWEATFLGKKNWPQIKHYFLVQNTIWLLIGNNISSLADTASHECWKQMNFIYL